MAAETLEERVQRLETTVQKIQERLAEQAQSTSHQKRGWRWFVGINADDPDFEEVVRLGEEWRNADRPADTGGEQTLLNILETDHTSPLERGAITTLPQTSNNKQQASSN